MLDYRALQNIADGQNKGCKRIRNPSRRDSFPSTQIAGKKNVAEMSLNPTGFLNTIQQHSPSFPAVTRILDGLFGGAGGI